MSRCGCHCARCLRGDHFACLADRSSTRCVVVQALPQLASDTGPAPEKAETRMDTPIERRTDPPPSLAHLPPDVEPPADGALIVGTRPPVPVAADVPLPPQGEVAVFAAQGKPGAVGRLDAIALYRKAMGKTGLTTLFDDESIEASVDYLRLSVLSALAEHDHARGIGPLSIAADHHIREEAIRADAAERLNDVRDQLVAAIDPDGGLAPDEFTLAEIVKKVDRCIGGLRDVVDSMAGDWRAVCRDLGIPTTSSKDQMLEAVRKNRHDAINALENEKQALSRLDAFRKRVVAALGIEVDSSGQWQGVDLDASIRHLREQHDQLQRERTDAAKAAHPETMAAITDEAHVRVALDAKAGESTLDAACRGSDELLKARRASHARLVTGEKLFAAMKWSGDADPHAPRAAWADFAEALFGKEDPRTVGLRAQHVGGPPVAPGPDADPILRLLRRGIQIAGAVSNLTQAITGKGASR